MSMWVNIDEHNGVPSQSRPDVEPPRHWRLDAIAAVGRPHHLTVSRDGTQVAFVLDAGDASDVWAMNADGLELRRLTTIRDPQAFWEDTEPEWSPNGTQVAFTADGWVHVVPARGGPPRKLVEAGAPRWLDDERLAVTVDRERRSRLCSVAVADPWAQPLSPADGHAGSVAITADGGRIAYVHFPAGDRRRSDLRLVDLTDGSETTVVSDPGHFVRDPAFSRDGRTIAFTSDRSGWNEIWVHDGTEVRQVTNDGADFSALAWDTDDRVVLAVRTRHGVGDLVTVDIQTGAVAVLARGGTWSSPGWTKGGSVIGIHEAADAAPRIVLVAGDGVQAVRLAHVPAAIEAAPHVTPEVVAYPSFDGLEIPGLLFRPAAAAEGRRPVVVYPHGGPASHYGDEWDGHAQYFLDKGYGWFAINFRGSTSYGLDFEHAEHGRWGVADTADCLAAHDYLATLEWVDPTRIAIFGASYGSYLAVAALARDPEHRYACGVAKYGDCDILTSWAQGDQVGAEDLERMMGHPSDNSEGYREGSPVHWVAGIARPLLIAHGEKDERVSLKQSQQLVDALRRHGKTFEFITYPTEGHGLLRRAPQLHFYERLERFLDWYLM